MHNYAREEEPSLLCDKLNEIGNSKLVLVSISLISTIILFILIWASQYKIDELSRSSGFVVPSSQIMVIQHLEGGIVKELLIEEGSYVNKGDLLVQLAKEPASSELEKHKDRVNSLRVTLTRLNAYINEKSLSINSLIAAIKYKSVITQDESDILIANQLALFKQQTNSRNKARREYQERVVQLEIDIESYHEQIKLLKDREQILNDQLKIYQDLDKTGSISKVELLKANEKVNQLKTEMLNTFKDLKKSESDLSFTKRSFDGFEADLIKVSLEEMNKLNDELLIVLNLVARAEDKVNRLEIIAPKSGIIKGLDFDPGNVLAPLDVLFEIVPTDKELFIEAKISNTDIGQIKLGDRANIKIDAYDFAVFGEISGIVSHISASTFLDDEGIPYYKAKIKMDNNFLGDDPNANKIIPGMTVMTEIKTNQRSLLSYLIHPVQRALGKSFKN